MQYRISIKKSLYMKKYIVTARNANGGELVYLKFNTDNSHCWTEHRSVCENFNTMVSAERISVFCRRYDKSVTSVIPVPTTYYTSK